MLNLIKKWLHISIPKPELSAYEKINNMFDSLSEEILYLKIGTDLSRFGDEIAKLVNLVRKEIKEECGFIFPAIRITEDYSLQENEIALFIRNSLISNIYVIPNKHGIKSELYEMLKTAIYENIDIIFSNELTEKYINTVQKENSWLVWNLTNVISISDIKTILIDIINRGKSINNINYIFEQIGETVLTDGCYLGYLKNCNPHSISKQIAKRL